MEKAQWKRITIIKKVIPIYIMAFSFCLLIRVMTVAPGITYGEWDDYSIMTASLMHDYNFTISSEDVDYAKNLFPEWSERYEQNIRLSGFQTRSGDLLAWYAPTYSFFCIPFVWLTSLLGISGAYAFRLANIFFLLITLFLVNRKSRLGDGGRFLMILALSLHPVIFYVKWPSAEVFLYCLLILSIISWLNRQYYQAAVYCSIAGTLNPVIMLWGIFMIIWYLGSLYAEKGEQRFFSFYFSRWKRILGYGSCYVIGILPLIYNYYQTGHINLSAAGHINLSAVGLLNKDLKLIIKYCFAYLFDLNFGFLPYFCVIMLLDFVIFFLALRRKDWKYLFLAFACGGLIFGYSMVLHINCGMAGISRYNVWNSSFLIIMAFYGIEEHLRRKHQYAPLAVSLLGIWMTFSVAWNGSSCSYVTMLPISTYVLDHFPALYYPLPSTFCSRVMHIDGAYQYTYPVIYYDLEGNVRKMLVNETCTEDVKKMLEGNKEDMQWLEKKLDEVVHEQYISVGRSHTLKQKQDDAQ